MQKKLPSDWLMHFIMADKGNNRSKKVEAGQAAFGYESSLPNATWTSDNEERLMPLSNYCAGTAVTNEPNAPQLVAPTKIPGEIMPDNTSRSG
jgi:hypothetical protein